MICISWLLLRDHHTIYEPLLSLELLRASIFETVFSRKNQNPPLSGESLFATPLFAIDQHSSFIHHYIVTNY